MTTRIIIDCDTGTDDALAILYALSRPDLDVLGITTVFGNTDIAQTTRNTLQVLELVGRAGVPVARGAEHPLVGRFTQGAAWIHGRNGLADIELPIPVRRPEEASAPEFLRRQLRGAPGEITLVATGRLTNIATLLRQDPECARLVRRCVLMGGAVTAPGNVTPVAEANICGDPEAAAIVFGSGMPMTMVGLDVTMRALLSQSQIDRLARAGGRVLDVASEIAAFRLRSYRRRDPRIGGCAIHDVLAVDVVADPTVVRTQRWPVEIETKGDVTRGMTVADRRPHTTAPPNADVCVEVEADRFLERFEERMGTYRGT
ncbi:MAG TPA: nucleoside hydrolase [bacterium]|nr:nucleoside hydrolase [bacterium]